jgi:hypothetical protein
VKWRLIRTNNRQRAAPTDPKDRVYALNLEGAEESALRIRQKLKKWYGYNSKDFPDGTKMHLIPPFQTLITFGQKAKYASLGARQAAINSRLCTGSTWELSVNLVLDKPEPENGFSLRQLILNIPSRAFPNKPLFHTVDRHWRSQTGITFTFLPENEEDARSYIARLIPFLKETASAWFMRLFPEEAKIRHLHSRWDNSTRQAYSAEVA